MLRPLLVVLLLLVAAVPARAATVTLAPVRGPIGGSQLTLLAGPGETNRVTMTSEPTGSVLVTDSGAALTPAGTCASLDAATVRCRPDAGAPVSIVLALLGDGADTFSATTAPGLGWDLLSVNGGPGNDQLSAAGVHAPALTSRFYGVEIDGGPGKDEIQGSSGPDDLAGGSGSDVIHGRAGDDVLDGDGTGETETGFDAAASDLLDGGSGEDTVSYAAHARGVTVDLTRPGSAGRPGEHDKLNGIDDVIGSAFSDRLVGNRGPNVLTGFRAVHFARHPRGGDEILGGGGADTLSGTTLADGLIGGPGNDQVILGGGSDSVDCGRGTDTMLPGATALPVPGTCERIDDGAVTFRSFKVAGARLVATVAADDDTTSCSETVTLRAASGGTVYGAAAWSTLVPARLSIALNAAGRRAAKARRTALLRTQNCTGGPMAWLVRL